MTHIRLVDTGSGDLVEQGVFSVEPEEVAPRPGVVESQQALDVEVVEEKPPEPPQEYAQRETFACDSCLFVAASKAGLLAHTRAKHKE